METSRRFPSCALLMAGANIHARMLLQALDAADLMPELVIDESGTKRAAMLQAWLANEIDNPPPIDVLMARWPGRYRRVDAFDGVEAKALLTDLNPDYVISGGAGIIRPALLQLPRMGFINIHPGLLPDFRGVDPVLWALASGGRLGATVHLMSEGIDEGPILLRRELPESAVADDALGTRLACMRHGAGLLVEFLRNSALYPPMVQDEAQARYYRAFPPERLAEADAAARARHAAMHRSGVEHV